MHTVIYRPTTTPVLAQRPILVAVLLLGSLLPFMAQLVPHTSRLDRLTGPVDPLPIQFWPNPRVMDTGIEMQANALGGTVSFLPQQVSLALPDDGSMHIRFIGSNRTARIVGGDKQPGVINDIRGNDPAKWHTNIPTFANLTYQALYPGIDLRYDGTVGRLKGTYLVQPNVDPSVIRWRYNGVQQVQLDAVTGDLQMVMQNKRVLTEHAPVAWQEMGERRVPVDVRYTLANGSVGFALGAYDPAQPLIIDPTLAYSTFLGGTSADQAYGITLDADGNIYLTGSTYSNDFPTTAEARGYDRDLFVTKFDQTGKHMLYSTVIGGRNADDGVAVAANADGEAVVTVTTFSDDFPTKQALADTGTYAAVLKLDAVGNLVFSTYLSATMYDAHRNVGLDQVGNIYLVADVENNDFGVLKLSPDGHQVLAEVTIGGRGEDTATALAVRSDGLVYLTGRTQAYRNNFPVTDDALQPECTYESAASDASCSRDAFLLILDANLQTRYSSFLGGSYFEEGSGIALDAQGNIAVVGTTHSADFPVKNAVQPACPDGPAPDNALHCYSWASFVTKFTPDGKQTVFSTYFSSSDWSADAVKDVAVDRTGIIHLLGTTNSTKYPIKDAFQPSLAAGICFTERSERLCEDAVVTAFTPSGALVYSTYLGGKKEEYPYGIAADANGNVWIAGLTKSLDLPTAVDAFQPQKSLNEDVFLAKVGSASGGQLDPRLSKKLYLPFVLR